jgi:putative endonuclease
MRIENALGRFGEDVAVAHLADDGYEIVDRNWRCRDGEIDIVARDGKILVFCEVKTRSSERFGTPAAAVVPRKAARIRRVAAAWLAEHGCSAHALRFDVVAVRRTRSGPLRISHVRGAF